MGNILHIDSGNWQELETSPRPVLVDFWAAWCGPCHALAPTFEKLAEAYGREMVFAKADVDEVPQLAEKFRVQAIPTLMLFKSGKPVEVLVGYHPYEAIEKVLTRHMTPAVAN
jgi:thioredoxin 1